MNGKRVTIYDLANALGISASYVSKALNKQPGVSKKVRELVLNKAAELNYRHNSHAANLRRGSSKTIGVIVPQINQRFFSEAIAGIEEACYEHTHSLIICQSHDIYEKEKKAVETLIHHNVDCILISVSAETNSIEHLEEIIRNNIHLVQFDRCLDSLESYKVFNNNQEASNKAVKSLIHQGYKNIAFLGGPEHLSIYKDRLAGYSCALLEEGIQPNYSYAIPTDLSPEMAATKAKELLLTDNPPDAFFTVSDLQSLAVAEVAASLNIKIPDELGIIGFANEHFTTLINPPLSTIDQKSKELGYFAANLYFNQILTGKNGAQTSITIDSELILRASSVKTPESI